MGALPILLTRRWDISFTRILVHRDFPRARVFLRGVTLALFSWVFLAMLGLVVVAVRRVRGPALKELRRTTFS
jgi:hypothetical protein